MAKTPISTCALIVGAGPVGVTLQLLLGRLGIPAILCERNVTPRSHPRAHYVSNRSMEIWRQLGNLDMALECIVEPLERWRYFKYCRHITDPHINTYGVKDHFKDHYTYGTTYFEEYSPSRIANIPQHKLLFLLKAISLRRSQIYNKLPKGRFHEWLQSHYQLALGHGDLEEAQAEKLALLGFPLCLKAENKHNTTNDKAETLVGVPFIDGGLEFVCFASDGMANGVLSEIRNVRDDTTLYIKSAFVIGADGIHSKIRSYLDGNAPRDKNSKDSSNLRDVISVHFQSNELGYHVSKNPAMMYFIFSRCISVLVCQGGRPAEFVAQIPYFADVGEGDCLSDELCREYIAEFVGKKLGDLSILNVQKWKVTTDVAESFNHESGRIMVAGDAAHLVAPAGGLGMNMGIADTYNLAWRIGKIIYSRFLGQECSMDGVFFKELSQSEKELISQYGKERRAVAQYTRDVCLKEIINGSKIAKHMWYNHGLVQNLLDKLPFLTAHSTLSTNALDFFKSMMKHMWNTPKYMDDIRKYSQGSFERENGSLGLLFPGCDIGYAYDVDENHPNDYNLYICSSHREYAPQSIIGRRIPHSDIYLCDDGSQEVFKISTIDLPSLVQPSVFHCFLVFSRDTGDRILEILSSISNSSMVFVCVWDTKRLLGPDACGHLTIADQLLSKPNSFINIIGSSDVQDGNLKSKKEASPLFDFCRLDENGVVDTDIALYQRQAIVQQNVKKKKLKVVTSNDGSRKRFSKHLMGAESDLDDVVIVLRPDGHILNIQKYPLGHHKNVPLEDHIRTICKRIG